MSPRPSPPTRPRRSPRRPARNRWWRPTLKWTGMALGGLTGAAIIAVIALWTWAGGAKVPPERIAWGLTFSSGAARGLGLDPHTSYLTILDQLHPKRLRLVAYWNEIEPNPGHTNYGDLDFQVTEAERRGISYVIVIGRKVPRWPECYTPGWAKTLPPAEQHERLLQHLTTTVARYDQGPHLLRWQVENEPFLNFGQDCPGIDEPLLAREVSLVHHLTARSVMITDSGETNWWLNASKYGEVFGSTLYRVVLNPKGQPFHHFLTPALYTRHANLIKKLHPNIQAAVIAELQAEPWTNIGIQNLPASYRDLTMSHAQFDTNTRFARDVGFGEVYYWGAEWWLYQRRQGDSYYWDQAARTFAQSAP